MRMNGRVLKKVFKIVAPAAPQTQRCMCTVLTDFDKKKKMAKKLTGMKEA